MLKFRCTTKINKENTRDIYEIINKNKNNIFMRYSTVRNDSSPQEWIRKLKISSGE